MLNRIEELEEHDIKNGFEAVIHGVNVITDFEIEIVWPEIKHSKEEIRQLLS